MVLVTSLEHGPAAIAAAWGCTHRERGTVWKTAPLRPPTSLWAPLGSPVDAPLGINLLDGGVLRVVVLHLWVAQLGAVDVDEDGGATGGVPGGRPAPDLAGASPGAEMQNLSVLGQEGARRTRGGQCCP